MREAYAIADDVAAARESAGAVACGWKLSATSRTRQRLLGIDHPIFGRLFADGGITNSRSATFASFIAPRIDAQLAFGLHAPLDPGGDVALLLASIDWIAPALAISDSRYRPGRRSAVELIADNASSAAFVVGAPVRLDSVVRLDAIGTQLIRNGSVLAVGTTANVLGDPFNALQLLAEHLAQRGQHAAPGEIVLSGAITEGFPVAPGDRFVARLRGIGTASVTFV